MLQSTTLVLLLVLCAGCTISERQSTENAHPASPPNLVIITSNSSSLPVRISTDNDFNKLSDFQKIVANDTDTTRIHLDGYRYFYISHRNVLTDTVLVTNGDTVRLDCKANNISRNIIRQNQSVESFILSFKRVINRSDGGIRTARIDSLKSIFYQINYSGVPMTGGDEYSKYQFYPLTINKKAFSEKPHELHTLVRLLKEKYLEQIALLKNEKEAPHSLRDVLSHMALNAFFDEVVQLDGLSGSNVLLEYINSDVFINDSLRYSPYAKHILGYYLARNYVVKHPEYARAQDYWDWKPAYEAAPGRMGDSLAKYARYLCLERMIDFGEPIPEVEQKYREFRNVYQDEGLNRLLERNYMMDISGFAQSEEDVHLMNLKRKTLSLDSLIRRNRGKVVYVDFWASWCGPCRESMPAARQLMQEYADKGITVVYLSIDKDVQKWQRASISENLENYPDSYIILNTEASRFLKGLNLTTIPRYLLFDQNGKLVHQDAQGPKGKAVRKQFDSLL